MSQLLNNNCILNKYVISQIIGHGNFGNIFKGYVIRTNEPIAIKVEKKELLTLKHETIVLNYLYEKSVKYIPKVYWYGTHCNFNCLIMPYYNCCLFDYIISSIVNDCLIKTIMIKMIKILKTVHECHVIHRDIKPQNFMIHDNNLIEIVLIDFGIAEFCIDKKDSELKKLYITGTPKYMSVYNHDGYLSSYRDDLISIGYICLWMLNKQLPWDFNEGRFENNNVSNLKNQKLKDEKNIFLKTVNEIIKTEENALLGVICKYLLYCHELNCNSIPHYNELIKIFENLHE